MLKQEDYVRFVELVDEGKEKYLEATGEQAGVILLDPTFAKDLGKIMEVILVPREICGLRVYLDVEVAYGNAVIKRSLEDVRSL